MRTKIGKQYILIPLIYITVIILLLHFQYSTDESFTRTIGSITINGEKAQAAITGKRGLENLSVDAFGFTFSFNASNPVLIETRDGLIHKVFALDFTPYTDGIDIDLGKGLSIRFLLENEDMRILPSASTVESIERIKLPVTLQPGISVKSGTGLPILAVSDAVLDETHFATVQEGISYDEDEGYFILETEEYGFKELAFRSAPPGIADPFTFWFAGKANFPAEAEYKTIVDDYLADGRNGWENARFSRRTGTWENGLGTGAFSEKIATILLSEAVGTGRFSRIQEDMTIASSEHKGNLTRLSSPFLGDVINRVNNYLAGNDDGVRYRALLKDAQNRDVSIFLRDDLLRLLDYSADGALADHALATLYETGPEDADVETCLGMAEFLLRTKEGDFASRITSIFDNRLISSLIVIDEGVYFTTGDRETVDIGTSLEAGMLFLEAGEATGNETYESLGRSLVVGALSLSDDNGFLPETIQTDGLTIRRSGGVLPPEDVYPLLVGNPYYPREWSAAEYFGDGSWIWSCAEEVSITSGPDRYSISFTYPRGETHYIAVHGLSPFTRMKLLGIDWKGDPIFQYYYSGWYYDPGTSTLFVKLRHRSEREVIEIYYEQPSPEVPEETAPEVLTVSPQ